MIDLDVAKFFDTCPHDLILKAVEANTDQKWICCTSNGGCWHRCSFLMVPCRRATAVPPKGLRSRPYSPISSSTMRFDVWMAPQFPCVRFERYVDDAVVHCASRHQALLVLASIAERMAEVGLELHPAKTKVVYCRDSNRRGEQDQHLVRFPGVYVPCPGGSQQADEHRVLLVRSGDQPGQVGRQGPRGSFLAHAPARQ